MNKFNQIISEWSSMLEENEYYFGEADQGSSLDFAQSLLSSLSMA